MATHKTISDAQKIKLLRAAIKRAVQYLPRPIAEEMALVLERTK
jgi:hypothetical protein